MLSPRAVRIAILSSRQSSVFLGRRMMNWCRMTAGAWVSSVSFLLVEASHASLMSCDACDE